MPLPSPAPAASQLPPDPLTPRELEVLAIVATGATNAEASRRLNVSLATVKSHLVNAYRKIGVNNRVEATRYYLAELSTATDTPAADAPLRARGARSLAEQDLETRIIQLEGVAAAADRLRRELEALRTPSRR
jgi:DNA-binding CsgD family transcriptional regulator